MKRELGPWVWCKWCANRMWYGGMGADWQDPSECQPTETYTDPVTGEAVPYQHLPSHAAKCTGLCAPRLTLTGHIRRALNLPLGEESE